MPGTSDISHMVVFACCKKVDGRGDRKISQTWHYFGNTTKVIMLGRLQEAAGDIKARTFQDNLQPLHWLNEVLVWKPRLMNQLELR